MSVQDTREKVAFKCLCVPPDISGLESLSWVCVYSLRYLLHFDGFIEVCSKLWLLRSDCQTDEPPNSWSRCVVVLLVKTQCFHCVKYVLNYITFILNTIFCAFNYILFVGIWFFYPYWFLIWAVLVLHRSPFGQKLNTDLTLLKNSLPLLSFTKNTSMVPRVKSEWST